MASRVRQRPLDQIGQIGGTDLGMTGSRLTIPLAKLVGMGGRVVAIDLQQRMNRIRVLGAE